MSDDIDALIGSPSASVAPLPSAGGEIVVRPLSPSAQGAFDGAERWNQDFGLWAPPLRSADADIFPDKPTLDARSRDVLKNDAYVQGGATLHKDNIVGAQFLLNARPASRIARGKQDDVWEAEFQEEVEELWELWADSPDNWVDAARQNNFTGLIRLAVGITLAAGEVLATAEWDRQGSSEFNTCIQMVDLDRLTTDYMSRMDPMVRAGIRRNNYGAPIAYQILTQHPADVTYLMKPFPKWVEVPIRKPWGRMQVIHLKEQQRVDQTRGVSEMSAALREMRMGHSLRDINLQHAVMQGVYAATITSELPTETLFQQLGGGEMTPEQWQSAFSNLAEGYMGSIGRYAGKAKGLAIDGARIPHLYPGTKLELQSPGANPTQGTAFEESLLRYIAATIGVSYEQLSRDYTKTNYSSARAAMTETWKFMQARKKAIADKFATMIYRLWLEEAINNDRLSTFTSKDAARLYSPQKGTKYGILNGNFDALSKCDWIGASRGQIDELKETEAALARCEGGLSTREDELARLGKDWRKVYRQIAREQALAEKLGITFVSMSNRQASGVAEAPTDGAQPQEKKAA